MSLTNHSNLERIQKPSQRRLLGRIVNALPLPIFSRANCHCHVTFSWFPNETSHYIIHSLVKWQVMPGQSWMLESWLDAGCCLNANRNAFLRDWCRFVQQILLSHNTSHAGTFLAMETAIFSLLPKLWTVMKHFRLFSHVAHAKSKWAWPQ